MEVTLSLIKKQSWMADEEAFSNVTRKITDVKTLTSKRRNHTHVGEFMRGWKMRFVYGTYKSDCNINPKFSLNDTWSLMTNAESELSENDKLFRRRMINGMRALEYLQEQINNDLTVSQIKQVHRMIMDKEKHKKVKDVLVGEFRTTPVYAGNNVFAPVNAIERLMSEALENYHSQDEPILAATTLFSELLEIHPFEDGNRRLCCTILSHVLMQRKCSLFPVLLSTFKRRWRRHIRQAVKKSPSMLYTMVAASLVYVWDNFEQNVALLEKSEKP